LSDHIISRSISFVGLIQIPSTNRLDHFSECGDLIGATWWQLGW